MATNKTLTNQNVDRNSSIVRHSMERVFCPTDLSSDSNHAIIYAAALSKIYNAKLFLCHCEEVLPPGGFPNPKIVFEDLVSSHSGLENLNKFDWEAEVVKGNATDMILNEATLRQPDLIVMHSRRRPYRAALLGSTTEKICRFAPCPVLVIHSDEREWVNTSTAEIDLKRILIAHDFSDHAELALFYALSLAQEFQSELHLLHVLQPRPEYAWYPPTNEESYQASELLRRAVPVEAKSRCNIQTSVREGQVYKEILNYTEEHNIDLICIGEHGKGLYKWATFGSNVDWVLRHAPCPVLVARPHKIRERKASS